MNRRNIIILISLFMFFSCTKNNNFKLDNNFELSGELELYLYKTIGKICIYSIDRSGRYTRIHDDGNIPLYTEEDIRRFGSEFILENDFYGKRFIFIAILLCKAKKVDLRDKENVVQRDGPYIKRSGCVIDIYSLGGDIIKTYIMKNGLDVFYEKSDENTFYEMPNILLDKFNINNDEFLSAFRDITSTDIESGELEREIYNNFTVVR
jgi:hypothetical protein